MGYHSRLKYLENNQANLQDYLAWKNSTKAQKQQKYATAAAQGGTRVPVARTGGYLIPMGASSTAKVVGAYPIFAANAGHQIATALKAAIQPQYQKLAAPLRASKSPTPLEENNPRLCVGLREKLLSVREPVESSVLPIKLESLTLPLEV